MSEEKNAHLYIENNIDANLEFSDPCNEQHEGSVCEQNSTPSRDCPVTSKTKERAHHQKQRKKSPPSVPWIPWGPCTQNSTPSRDSPTRLPCPWHCVKCGPLPRHPVLIFFILTQLVIGVAEMFLFLDCCHDTQFFYFFGNVDRYHDTLHTKNHLVF